MHPFEKAGLGIAPYRLIRVISLPERGFAGIAPNLFTKAMSDAADEGRRERVSLGKCQFCGTALKNNFIIEATCGHRSVVGCDCVRRTDDETLIATVEAADRERQQAAREAVRQAKAARAEQQRKAAQRAQKRAERRFWFDRSGDLFRGAITHRHRSAFIASVLRQFLQHGRLTDAQFVALSDAVARAQRRATPRPAPVAERRASRSQHVGAIGERHQRRLTLIAQFPVDSRNGQLTLSIMRDTEGNSYKTLSHCPLERQTPTLVRFEVRKHDAYKGEPQTVIGSIYKVDEVSA